MYSHENILESDYLYNVMDTAHQSELGSTREEKFANYATYVKSRFTTASSYSGHNQWPPPVTDKVFRLAMIKKERVQRGNIKDEFVEKTITGKVDDILQHKVPIKLKDLELFEDKPKKVLLEGAPGCGKSTLSLNICQQWSDGLLFEEFQLVVLVRLREIAVQEANSIAGILPQRDPSMAREMAQEISACDGSGVLFVLDGWDEFNPKEPEQSIIHSLVFKEKTLHKSSIIITSRPTSSASLHRIVTTRIEILGFTREELRHYFTKCLQNDMKAVDTLLQRIQENPAVAGSCYLPLNASILVHLFKCEDNSLPTTRYGIFSALVLNCIFRHVKERMTQHIVSSLESLEDLPKVIQDPFGQLCKLAYQGIMDNKIVFKLPADINTLGLLQGVESFVMCGTSHSYNFLHLSIQELLAAYHIATALEDKQQIVKFKELFGQDRFNAVFQFYAAKTKLQTPGISDILVQVAEKCAVEIPQDEDKVHLLSLLNCLFEAQDTDLCRFVAGQLQSKLELRGTSLSPADCLSISYFLVCTTGFDVNLYDCSIGADGCKTLFKPDEVYNIQSLRYSTFVLIDSQCMDSLVLTLHNMWSVNCFLHGILVS